MAIVYTRAVMFFRSFVRFAGQFSGGLLALLLVGGCAGRSSTEALTAEPSVTEAAAQERRENRQRRQAEPAFDIRVEADDKMLRELVAQHNALQSYRVLSDLDGAEFVRLTALAKDNVRELLGTEGYFAPRIEVSQQRSEQGREEVVIAFEPGPRAKVQALALDFEGQIADADDAAALAQQAAIRDNWRLLPGKDFTQDAWSSAKTGALRQLVEQRYPRGRISHSSADVDAERAEVRLGLRLVSGPMFRLGPATVEGNERYPAVLAERLSWLKPGEPYEQKRLIDAQQRLAGSGYYESAYISIDPEGDPEAVPVRYTVVEAKRHKTQLGVGFSTDGGPRLTLDHRDNTWFGSSWRADYKLHLNQKEPLAQLELSSLPNAGGWRWGGLVRLMRQDDGPLNTVSKTLRLGRVKSGERYDRHLYVQYDHANVTGSGAGVAPDALLGDGAAVSANYAWTGRYFDSLPVPKRGYGLSADVGVGVTTVAPRKPFTRLWGRWLGIVPLSKDGHGSRLALRTEAGAVLASRQARLPLSYLFRTGGDASVRGYAYRRIGLPLAGGIVGPGRYMWAAGAEWQRPILQERFPGLFEHALFIDVGSVASEVHELRPHWGVGTGLRVITPVGPMQLDIAYGLKTRDIRLHMNVGFVF